MSENRPKTAIGKGVCPVSDVELDVVPECYHYSNRCICFMCNCGNHICPSQKKSFHTKDTFKTSYKRCFSRPSITPSPQRMQAYYHKNNQKMDMETEYRKKYSGFTVECVQVPQSVSPQPAFKFEGTSQYNRDFPNWGPIDYHRIKRPVHPVHDTKLKFSGKSSYEQFYQPVKSDDVIKKTKSVVSKGNRFVMPLQSSSQRDYQKISNDYFPNHEHKKVEEYIPLNYNPHQFKTTAKVSYASSVKHIKDPFQVRKQALYFAK